MAEDKDHYREIGMDQPAYRHTNTLRDEKKMRADDVIGDHRLLLTDSDYGWLVQHVRTKDVVWMKVDDLIKIRQGQLSSMSPDQHDFRGPLR